MNPIQPSSEVLIDQFKRSGNRKEYPRLISTLFQRHREGIERRCYYYVKDHETARDLSQEVWVRILTKLYQFRTERVFTAWVFGIVHNLCQDYIRQNKAALRCLFSQEIANSMGGGLETEDTNEPTIEILEELINSIRGEERLLLLLKYEQKWTVKAIAQGLNISESSVKMRLSRARKRLRKRLSTL